MKLQTIYQTIIKKGIAEDIRAKSAIEADLKKKKQDYEKAGGKLKEAFDLDTLFNPFADTRILNGNPDAEIKSLMVGIDVEEGELLLVDRLKEKGTPVDLAMAHHPEGKAFAGLHEVMDLQVDAYIAEGVSASFAQDSLLERKTQVEKKIHSANGQRSVDTARLLGINFLCAHTPADNCAYQYIHKLVDKEKPENLQRIIDLLYDIPEYFDAAKNNNPPKIANGSGDSRVAKIHLEFTGGTEGPSSVYDKLSSSGVDTIIAMHQSEEHLKKCKEAHINVIFASHIASDTLGVNLLLDDLESKEKFKIYEFSGFRRFPRKSHR
jgi:putative NIF3 family GTP cyclohydrolase 1 type 2